MPKKGGANAFMSLAAHGLLYLQLALSQFSRP